MIYIQVFKLHDIKPILVPQYEELTADKIYPKVKGYIENLSDYFPEYDSTYIPPRKFFWDIFQTLNQKLAEKFIDHSIKERNNQKVTQESRKEISADIMEQINKKHFYSKQKGRALSMQVTDKEIYKINRKREYFAYEPTIEESKEYKSKRLIPINYDSVNENRLIWKENDQNEFEQALEEIKEQESNKDDERMIVDKPKYNI